QVNGKTYPAGSYVVKTAQAFRPHILDMFEPQDHPDDFAYPGGPPIPPYDNAGWTLAFQMGVVFDRILDGFDGPFEAIQGLAKAPAGNVAASKGPIAGYLLSHQTNDSFIATNRLLAANEEVYWLSKKFDANGRTYAPGTIFIPAKATTLGKLQKIATDLGLSFDAVTNKPTGDALKLRPLRVALWDRYGGSMPSGWTRWILEQYEFPFTVVYPPTLDEGDLSKKYDVIIFVDGAIPGTETGRRGGGGGGNFGGGNNAENIPEEYRSRMGSVTAAKTIPQLRRFMEQGGTVITIGTSNNLAYHLGLPITSALTEKNAEGVDRPLPRDKFYVPGSVLQVHVDNTNPLAFGMNEKTDVFFDNSPSFRLRTDAGLHGIKPVAWFDTDHPLRRGWAWGQKYLQDSAAVIDANVGSGKLLMFGPEILFRGQPH